MGSSPDKAIKDDAEKHDNAKSSESKMNQIVQKNHNDNMIEV